MPLYSPLLPKLTNVVKTQVLSRHALPVKKNIQSSSGNSSSSSGGGGGGPLFVIDTCASQSHIPFSDYFVIEETWLCSSIDAKLGLRGDAAAVTRPSSGGAPLSSPSACRLVLCIRLNFQKSTFMAPAIRHESEKALKLFGNEYASAARDFLSKTRGGGKFPLPHTQTSSTSLPVSSSPTTTMTKTSPISSPPSTTTGAALSAPSPSSSTTSAIRAAAAILARSPSPASIATLSTAEMTRAYTEIHSALQAINENEEAAAAAVGWGFQHHYQKWCGVGGWKTASSFVIAFISIIVLLAIWYFTSGFSSTTDTHHHQNNLSLEKLVENAVEKALETLRQAQNPPLSIGKIASIVVGGGGDVEDKI